MKRLAEQFLQKWLTDPKRTPLIIRGARQVGKSTLVRQFCQNAIFEKENAPLKLIEINLEYEELESLKKDKVKVEDIIDELELMSKTKVSNQTLIFFDEIQEAPKLINLLRYFYELKPHIPIIACGSLLEIVLNEGTYSFPVGRVSFYHLGPMTFHEFLLACGEEQLSQRIKEKRIDSAKVHNLALEYLKKYFFIGGMPKVIDHYSKTHSLVEIREIQQQILQAYMLDFPKYNRRIDTKRMGRIFKNIAFSLGKKISYREIDSESKSREVKRVLELLVDAKVLLPTYHVEASGLPLVSTLDERIIKYYFLDIGLLNCLHQLDPKIFLHDFDHLHVTKGILAEQFIAQHIQYYSGPNVDSELLYWLKDKGAHKAEIDFLVECDGNIWPIEVKSGEGGSLKSLFYFAHEKKVKRAVKFSLAPYGTKTITHLIEGEKVLVELKELPLYGAEDLRSHLQY
jgi:predicted AAA+ superfamily ATPase